MSVVDKSGHGSLFVTLFTESLPQSQRGEVKQNSVSRKDILIISLHDVYRDLYL